MSEVEVSEDDDDSRREDSSRSKGDDKSPIKKVKRKSKRCSVTAKRRTNFAPWTHGHILPSLYYEHMGNLHLRRGLSPPKMVSNCLSYTVSVKRVITRLCSK